MNRYLNDKEYYFTWGNLIAFLVIKLTDFLIE